MGVIIVPDDYATIDAALGHLGAGDELQIRAGSYAEGDLYVPAVVGAGLIRPFPGDEGLVIVAGDGVHQTWRVHAVGVEFRDLIGENAAVGSVVWRLNADAAVLTRCKVRNHVGYGVQCAAATVSHQLVGCRFTGGSGATAVAVDLSGALVSSWLVDCIIEGAYYDGVRPGTGTRIWHSTIKGCTNRGVSDLKGGSTRNLTLCDNAGLGLYLNHASADADYLCFNGNGTDSQVVSGTLGAHLVSGDPLYAVDLLSMDPASPCRDAGEDLSVATDYNGDPRPVGSAPDIGHLEFQGLPPRVLSASADGLYHVIVTFDQGVDGAALTDPTAWAIAALSGGAAVTISAVAYDAATFRATLTTSAHTADQVYRVTAPAAVVSLFGDLLDAAYDEADYLTPQATGREAGNPWSATGDGMTLDLGAGPYELVPWAADAPLADLAQAVWISLFSDRRAEDGDALPDTAGDPPYRGGWWADALTGDPIGSRLWLLRREPITDEVATLAREYAEEALAWMVSGGYAAAVDCTVERLRAETLALTATITKTSGETLTLRYADLWAAFEGV